MPEAVQRKMESFFQTSFADVRVHVGPEAPSIGALAFTHGSDLYFAPGQYNPHSSQGQQLLGHELAHVVQQRAGRVRNPLGSGVAVVQDSGLEAEADRMGMRAATTSLPVQTKPAGSGTVATPASRPSTVAANGAILPSLASRPTLSKQISRPTASGSPAGSGEVAQPFVVAGAVGLGLLGLGLATGAGYLYRRMTAPPVFKNHHPKALPTEISEYLTHWKNTRAMPEDMRAYVYVYQREPDKFRNKIRSKQKFLWTYDVNGYLSIGTPEHNKHAIVGAGKDVYAAGIGQLKITEEEDQYSSYLEIQEKADALQRQGKTNELENPYLAMAEEMRIERPARFGQNNVVVLDFDSGHYHPGGAWRKTIEAWTKAGFQVEKSTISRRV